MYTRNWCSLAVCLVLPVQGFFKAKQEVCFPQETGLQLTVSTHSVEPVRATPQRKHTLGEGALQVFGVVRLLQWQMVATNRIML